MLNASTCELFSLRRLGAEGVGGERDMFGVRGKEGVGRIER